MRVCFVEDKGKKSKYVIKTKSRRTGLKTIPTACTFSRDGLLVAAACQDGSIQMWDHRKTFVNVALQVWKHSVEKKKFTFTWKMSCEMSVESEYHWFHGISG